MGQKMSIKLSSLLGLFALLCVSACSKAYVEYKIIDTSLEKEISLKKLAKELINYDVIIFGDLPEFEVVHELQVSVLPLLQKNSEDLVLSMQIFDRTMQESLDKYVTGLMPEEEFIKATRVDNNYQYDYREIVEYARKERLQIIASNAPRNYVANVETYGLEFLTEGFDSFDARYFAKKVHILDDLYKANFMATILEEPARINDFSLDALEDKLECLFEAQSLGDDTMAESIVKYQSVYPNTKIIHYGDDFRSNGKLGIVSKLLLRNPELRIAVISPKVLKKNETLRKDRRLTQVADFIILCYE